MLILVFNISAKARLSKKANTTVPTDEVEPDRISEGADKEAVCLPPGSYAFWNFPKEGAEPTQNEISLRG